MIVQVIDTWGGNVVGDTPTDGDIIRITRDNGSVVEKVYIAPVVKPTVLRVYVHINVSGGDNGTPVAIKADGVDAAEISFVLRESADPGSNILSGINRAWDVPLRDGDGLVHDYLRVVFVSGQSTINYTTTRPGMIMITDKDVDTIIGSAVVTLATAPRFLAYRIFN